MFFKNSAITPTAVKIRGMNMTAKVIRADGTVEKLGIICSSNPVLKVWIRMKDLWRKLVN